MSDFFQHPTALVESPSIGRRKQIDPRFAMPDKRSIDLFKAVRGAAPMLRAEQSQDSHILLLDNRI